MPSDASFEHGEEQFWSVRLRVTNKRTGVSQVHEELVEAVDSGQAEERAKENVLSDDEDVFHVLETMDFGGDDSAE